MLPLLSLLLATWQAPVAPYRKKPTKRPNP